MLFNVLVLFLQLSKTKFNLSIKIWKSTLETLAAGRHDGAINENTKKSNNNIVNKSNNEGTPSNSSGKYSTSVNVADKIFRIVIHVFPKSSHSNKHRNIDDNDIDNNKVTNNKDTTNNEDNTNDALIPGS